MYCFEHEIPLERCHWHSSILYKKRNRKYKWKVISFNSMYKWKRSELSKQFENKRTFWIFSFRYFYYSRCYTRFVSSCFAYTMCIQLGTIKITKQICNSSKSTLITRPNNLVPSIRYMQDLKFMYRVHVLYIVVTWSVHAWSVNI